MNYRYLVEGLLIGSEWMKPTDPLITVLVQDELGTGLPEDIKGSCDMVNWPELGGNLPL